MKPQQSVILPSSLLIDPTKEPLHIVLKPYSGITHVPPELASSSGPELMVFIELNKCFEKAGFVAEGMLANIIWGFENCGYDPRHVAAGLTSLRSKDYVYYTNGSREKLSEVFFDPHKPIWIRYDKKFTDLFIRSVAV